MNRHIVAAAAALFIVSTVAVSPLTTQPVSAADGATVSVTLTGVRQNAYDTDASVEQPTLFSLVAGEWRPAVLGSAGTFAWRETGPGTWSGEFTGVPVGEYRFGFRQLHVMGFPYAPLDAAPVFTVGGDDLRLEYRIPDASGVRGVVTTEDGPVQGYTWCSIDGAEINVWPMETHVLADYWGSPYQRTPMGYFELWLGEESIGERFLVDCVTEDGKHSGRFRFAFDGGMTFLEPVLTDKGGWAIHPGNGSGKETPGSASGRK